MGLVCFQSLTAVLNEKDEQNRIQNCGWGYVRVRGEDFLLA